MNKIFWAFDALEDDLKTNVFVGETLASLNEKLKAEIYPVFTFGSEIMESFASEMAGAIRGVTDEKMRLVLSKVKIPGIVYPEIIVERTTSKSHIVKRFINHAEKNGATVIAVGSHGRAGWERATLGSFAETLLLQCHLPVLTVGPHFDQIPKWEEILFPTDFGDDSSFAFYKALDLAKILNAKVTVFHHISRIIDSIIQSAIAPFGGVWVSYNAEMKGLKERSHKALNEWAAKAQKEGVEVRTFLDSETSDTSEAILSYAKANKIGLIAMGVQSGTLSTTLFGAITRKVVRQALCPVWLLRRH